jgi:hypothetical protein
MSIHNDISRTIRAVGEYYPLQFWTLFAKLESGLPAVTVLTSESKAPETVHAIGPLTEKPKGRVWVAKVLVLVISLLVCMEGGSRLILSISPLRRQVTGFDDASWRQNWVRQRKAHKEINGEYAAYHPTRGWALRPGIEDMRVFEGKILNTNSHGLRGKAEYNYQRTEGKQRILILGDSFTFGTGVSDDETYSHYLESTLPNVDVLNLGVQGYGQDQMLVSLKEEGVKYHPDVVILGFDSADAFRNLLTFFGYAKPEFEMVAGGLRLTNVPVPTPDQVLAQEPYRSQAVDLGVMLRARITFKLGITGTKARNLTRLILDEIVATTHDANATPVFVYLPILGELQDSNPAMNADEKYFSDYCQKRAVPCLLLRPRFVSEIREKVRFIGKDGHWNAEAHRRAAQGIADFLLESGLIHASASDAGLRAHAGAR